MRSNARNAANPSPSLAIPSLVPFATCPLGATCYLIIRPKKGVCKDCDKHPTTWQKLDWCDPKSRHTKAYEQHLVLALVNSTVADVSIKEAVGKKVVRGVIDRWISQEIDWKSLKKLGLLGIDEIGFRCKLSRIFTTCYNYPIIVL